ncbi:MAG TPA: peptidoglycan DD-metalloendopeptidase family protein [Burkholderiales bacterium]|nr:peptidoglycan DD-metalloendopeptidase family protein [Burkholderiales bacterium]
MSIPMPAELHQSFQPYSAINLVQQDNQATNPLQAPAHNTINRSMLPHTDIVRSGTVHGSFSISARRLGIPYPVIFQFVHILSSRINFRKGIWPGDKFWVIYRRSTGQNYADNHLLAAKFCHLGQCHTAYWYAFGKAVKGYFSATGSSLKRSFLRFPLAYSRVSSPFARLRFDPVLKKWLPHDGVDLVAPEGSPIHATANGYVKFMGWQRGYGKVVILQNGHVYSTLYAHMSRFAHLHIGSPVRQGMVIGYVGMTGWATGPHLHYELRVRNVPENPLKVRLPAAITLRGKNKLRFSEIRNKLAAFL